MQNLSTVFVCLYEITYVIIQLLQDCLINLNDKGAGVSVVKHRQLSAGPLCCHLVESHLYAPLFARHIRHLLPWKL